MRLMRTKYHYSYSSLLQLSKASGWWPYLLRMRVTRPLAFLFINYSDMHPNTITIIAFTVSVSGGIFYATGHYWGLALGAVIFEIGQILDGVDGLIARVKKKASPQGAYLDFFLDRVRNVLVALCLGLGQYRLGDKLIFFYLLLYVGIKKIYLVSQIYQEKVLRDAKFTFSTGRQMLTIHQNDHSFLSKYLSFCTKMKIAPYYSDLDTDFLVFVFFPVLNRPKEGIILGSILLLIVCLVINFLFVRTIKETRVESIDFGSR